MVDVFEQMHGKDLYVLIKPIPPSSQEEYYLLLASFTVKCSQMTKFQLVDVNKSDKSHFQGWPIHTFQGNPPPFTATSRDKCWREQSHDMEEAWVPTLLLEERYPTTV